MSFRRFMRKLFRRGPQHPDPQPRSPTAKHCPTCGSAITTRRLGGCDPEGRRWDGMEFICPQCGPIELEDPFAPDNDAEPVAVTTNSDGWVQCPCCGFRFCATTDEFFRFGRHRRCGQRLIVTNSNATGNA